MNPYVHLGAVQSLRAEREAAARNQRMVNVAKRSRSRKSHGRLQRPGR